MTLEIFRSIKHQNIISLLNLHPILMLLMYSLEIVERNLLLLIPRPFLGPLVAHLRLAPQVNDHRRLPIEYVAVSLVHLAVDSVLGLIDEPEIAHQLAEDVSVGEDAALGDLDGGGVLAFALLPLLDAGEYGVVQEGEAPSLGFFVVVFEDVEALPSDVLPFGHWLLD